MSQPGNPFAKAAGIEAEDILPTLDVEGTERLAMSNLDAYGSSPVTGDGAAGRPLNPPTIAGDDANA